MFISKIFNSLKSGYLEWNQYENNSEAIGRYLSSYPKTLISNKVGNSSVVNIGAVIAIPQVSWN